MFALRQVGRDQREPKKKKGPRPFWYVCRWSVIRRLVFGIPGPLTFIVEGLAVGAEGVDSIYCLQERKRRMKNERKKKKVRGVDSRR
jgi:hypothetical protein